MKPLENNVGKLVLIMEVSKHNTVAFMVASTNLWQWHQLMVNMKASEAPGKFRDGDYEIAGK